MTLKLINCAEIAGNDWTFLKESYPKDCREVEWEFHSATPSNFIEKKISRPKISRIRATVNSISSAKKYPQSLLISHLPRTTAMLSSMKKLSGLESKHIAFSFNFTQLPVGVMRKYMSMAFKDVDNFVVFSQYEKEKYSEYFDLDINKLKMLHWAMDEPVYSDFMSALDEPYICATGGEGRDYKTLIEAMKRLPSLKLKIVSRPDSLKGISLPDNVELLTNISYQDYWAVVKNSLFNVIPLKDQSTPCGHITIVGSFLLGKPIVSTFSNGTSDYLVDEENGLISNPNDVDSLKNNIEKLIDDSSLYEKLSNNGLSFAKDNCSMKNWSKYLCNYIETNIN